MDPTFLRKRCVTNDCKLQPTGSPPTGSPVGSDEGRNDLDWIVSNHEHSRYTDSDSDNEYFACPCGKTFKSRILYQRHVEIAHGDTEAYLCPICGKTFGKRGSLTMHMSVHDLCDRQSFEDIAGDKNTSHNRVTKCKMPNTRLKCASQNLTSVLRVNDSPIKAKCSPKKISPAKAVDIAQGNKRVTRSSPKEKVLADFYYTPSRKVRRSLNINLVHDLYKTEEGDRGGATSLALKQTKGEFVPPDARVATVPERSTSLSDKENQKESGEEASIGDSSVISANEYTVDLRDSSGSQYLYDGFLGFKSEEKDFMPRHDSDTSDTLTCESFRLSSSEKDFQFEDEVPDIIGVDKDCLLTSFNGNAVTNEDETLKETSRSGGELTISVGQTNWSFEGTQEIKTTNGVTKESCVEQTTKPLTVVKKQKLHQRYHRGSPKSRNAYNTPSGSSQTDYSSCNKSFDISESGGTKTIIIVIRDAKPMEERAIRATGDQSTRNGSRSIIKQASTAAAQSIVSDSRLDDHQSHTPVSKALPQQQNRKRKTQGLLMSPTNSGHKHAALSTEDSQSSSVSATPAKPAVISAFVPPRNGARTQNDETTPSNHSYVTSSRDVQREAPAISGGQSSKVNKQVKTEVDSFEATVDDFDDIPDEILSDVAAIMDIDGDIMDISDMLERVKGRSEKCFDDGTKKTCEVCGKFFSSEKYLKMHMSLHKVDTPSCSLVAENYKVNEGNEIVGNSSWTCKICNKTFAQNSSFKNHMRTHSDERPFVCDVCSIGFKERYHLKKHMLFKHSSELKEKCQICGKGFKDSTAVRAHERIHSNDRPYRCRRCDKAFKTSECLWHHENRSKSCHAKCVSGLPDTLTNMAFTQIDPFKRPRGRGRKMTYPNLTVGKEQLVVPGSEQDNVLDLVQQIITADENNTSAEAMDLRQNTINSSQPTPLVHTNTTNQATASTTHTIKLNNGQFGQVVLSLPASADRGMVTQAILNAFNETSTARTTSVTTQPQISNRFVTPIANGSNGYANARTESDQAAYFLQQQMDVVNGSCSTQNSAKHTSSSAYTVSILPPISSVASALQVKQESTDSAETTSCSNADSEDMSEMDDDGRYDYDAEEMDDGKDEEDNEITQATAISVNNLIPYMGINGCIQPLSRPIAAVQPMPLAQMNANRQGRVVSKSRRSNYTCPKCGRGYAVPSAFQNHMQLHNQKRPYRCEKCDYGFNLKVHLKKHNLYVHSDEYRCKCGVCDKPFKDSSALRLHERIHSDERPFICACGKSFKTRENLWGHQNRKKCPVAQQIKEGAQFLTQVKIGRGGEIYKTVLMGQSTKDGFVVFSNNNNTNAFDASQVTSGRSTSVYSPGNQVGSNDGNVYTNTGNAMQYRLLCDDLSNGDGSIGPTAHTQGALDLSFQSDAQTSQLPSINSFVESRKNSNASKFLGTVSELKRQSVADQCPTIHSLLKNSQPFMQQQEQNRNLVGPKPEAQSLFPDARRKDSAFSLHSRTSQYASPPRIYIDPNQSSMVDSPSSVYCRSPNNDNASLNVMLNPDNLFNSPKHTDPFLRAPPPYYQSSSLDGTSPCSETNPITSLMFPRSPRESSAMSPSNRDENSSSSALFAWEDEADRKVVTQWQQADSDTLFHELSTNMINQL